MAKKKTSYGVDRYRTPFYKGEFRYPQGSKQKAVILDIDGCIIDWGDQANQKVREYAKKHYELGHVLIVMTARDHEYMYTSSFNLLMHVLPYPFIGPFCRPKDDPRYASEFKRETAEHLSYIFDIVGAADDNKQVIQMWKWWATEYGPKDFDLLETEYTSYPTWRESLPNKGASATHYATKPGSWASAYPKHRAAGSRAYETNSAPWPLYTTGWGGVSLTDEPPTKHDIIEAEVID